MLNTKKISAMTKLAVYDKRYADNDSRILEYFRHDYVYKKNFKIRVNVIFAGIIITLLSYGNKIFTGDLDVFSLNLQTELRNIVVFFLFLGLFYTVIGTIKSNYEYSSALTRQLRYNKLADKLCALDNLNKEVR